MFEGTLDRDVRLSPDEIIFLQVAVRDELRKRNRSIRTAEASKAAGNKVQYGTLDEHYRARTALQSTLEKLDVAQRQIQHRIKARLAAS
jgi:FtsZ-binding cell division protein ZapB